MKETEIKTGFNKWENKEINKEVNKEQKVFRTEKQVLDYITEAGRSGSRYGLEGIRELLKRLGNPQDTLRFVHIAGTNGKGSVLAYVSTVLKEAGYRTGRYISPAVFGYRERMQINGKWIPVKALCRHMSEVREAAEGMVREGMAAPTAFEQETAAAFLWYVQKECDVVVLETGMGGALDATNIIQNTLAAVITPISRDHMTFLGNTLQEIAENKAGIIKNGCYVISAAQRPEVEQVLRRVCEERGARFRTADAAQAVRVHYGIEKQRFSYQNYQRLEITMPGLCQIENAVIAVETCEALRECGFTILEEQLRRGMLQTVWPGRLSLLQKKTYILIDGAHNEDAAGKLADSLRFYFTNRKIIYIMGILRDKEYEKIVRETCMLAEHILTVTPPHNPRALQAYELAQTVNAFHPKVTALDSLEEAAELGCLLAGPEGVVVAFGSLSWLGEFSRIVENRVKKRGSHPTS